MRAEVSFWEAFGYWLKLGFLSFGGPAGQISMMHEELVVKRKWISEHRFMHALNYTMVLPGPEAQQLATYIGWLMHGLWGGIVAGFLFVFPSLFILIALTWGYLSYGDFPAVQGVLYGIKPAVTAIVLFAAYRIGSRALGNRVLRGIALAALTAIFVLNIPFPLIVFSAGIFGILGSLFSPELFKQRQPIVCVEHPYEAAIIDDTTPIPEHARFRWQRFLLYLLLGISLWGGAISLLLLFFGWEGTLTQMGLFFTKAAFVTFGGAYAVLPYVYQGGFEQYGWISAVQMIDGLALGETTPGPLIIVVAFIGFVGGWTKELFGPELLPLAGIAGAFIATFFTFLPSFLFILIGGPAVEATRHDVKFTAPLMAITAAVVGGIVNLALFFAYHVLWPQGFDGPLEWFSALIGLAAFWALFRYKLPIVPVIAASSVVGLAYVVFL